MAEWDQDRVKGAALLKVRPLERKVAAVLVNRISPATIRHLCGRNEVRAMELCIVNDYPLRFVGPVLTLEEQRTLPRWQFGELPPIVGDGVLFGANKAGKAAESPITIEQAMASITWLPPVSEIGGVLVG